MAIQSVFVLRDTKVGAFNKPIFLQNEAVLKRALSDAMRDEHSTISMHPEDYQAYALGTYNEDTGKLEVYAPVHLFNLIDLETDK